MEAEVKICTKWQVKHKTFRQSKKIKVQLSEDQWVEKITQPLENWEWNETSPIKGIREKPTANITLNGFSLRSDIRKECSFLPDSLVIVLEVLANAMSQEKEDGKGGSNKIVELRVPALIL